MLHIYIYKPIEYSLLEEFNVGSDRSRRKHVNWHVEVMSKGDANSAINDPWEVQEGTHGPQVSPTLGTDLMTEKTMSSSQVPPPMHHGNKGKRKRKKEKDEGKRKAARRTRRSQPRVPLVPRP